VSANLEDEAVAEGQMILSAIAAGLPRTIDAREAICEMQAGGSTQWRQMEWIGFYPEFWFRDRLAISLDVTDGPKLGNMTFDIKRRFVWDLKAHAEGSSTWAPLNDVEAVRNCITNYDGVGFFAISGSCTYDVDGSFKRWHDELKGGPSAYALRNEARGAPSRKRKTSFEPKRLVAFRFSSLDQLDRALSEGWIKGFQKDMQNSNGVPRREKIQVDLMRIGKWSIVSEIHV
jgi:hypothetical protein